MSSWLNFKEQYTSGSIIEMAVARKAPPGLIFFDFTDAIQGSLHVSELNWNFGLCQSDFRNIKVGEVIRVYVISFDDKYRKVFLGRKFLIEKPSDSDAWKNLTLRKEINAIVFETFQNKVIIQLYNGLFGSIPLIREKTYSTAASIRVIPVRKVLEQNVVDCTIKEIAGLPEEQSSAVLKYYKETVPDNSFSTSENCLHSIKQLSSSLYWNYFSTEERKRITHLYETNDNLFSKIDKGDDPIYFEFDFNNRAYQEFITNIAPALFPSIYKTENNYLVELSKQSFWYTQYFQKREVEGTEQKIVEKYFSLYNEVFSLWGKIEDGNLKILTVKAKVRTDSLKEKQQALKRHNNFLVGRPTIFYYKLHAVPIATYNQTFIQSIDNKIEALNLFQIAKEKSIEILLKHGKDFKIFSNYLESQIEFETKAANDTEIELKRCWLNIAEIQNEVTNFFGELAADSTIQKDEQVLISVKGKKSQPIKLERGRVLAIKNKTINIVCPSIQLEQIQEGCYIKRIVSTKQYRVQLSVLEKFFENTLPLEHFYNIFHNREGILPPKEIAIRFKNSRLADSQNPQSAAVNKAVANENILLIQGPPGTGKTTVIIEIVKQLIESGEKILVASPTHVAVDNVLRGIKDDKRISIARIGHQETVSDFSQEFLIDEARKTFAEKIQTISDIKIELIKHHLNGKDISQYSRSSFHEPYTFDWDNIDNFVKMIQSGDLKDCTFHIENLESWKEVIAKSPAILTDIFLRNLDVVFGTCIGIATNKLFSESELIFDTVILDEAGKANISETLTAVSRAKKIILVGDHKQLPPYFDKERVEYFKTFSKDYEERPKDHEIKQALGASFFEYLQQDGMLPPENKVLLSVQHRMHPDIGNFISQSFYDSELLNGERTVENVIPLQPPFHKQIIFIDTSTDKASMETYKDGSYFNQVEAELIVGNIIPELLRNNISSENFAIVSPYSKQCEKITELVEANNSHSLESLEVATLDSFQGREHDIIIFTFTRSSIDKTVGFLDDARRLNVAFSRARKKLILIGNVDTLTSKRSHYDQYYGALFWKLFKYSRQYGSVYKIKELNFHRLQNNIKEGSIVDGTVKRFEKYGVFVNLGTVDGLIPLSEISWNFISDPANVFEIRQKIKVKILKIESNGRISLSHKQTIPQARASYPKNHGQKSFGKDTKIEIFEKEFKIEDTVEAFIIQIIEENKYSMKVVLQLKHGVKGVLFTSSRYNRLKTGQIIYVIITKIQLDKHLVRCKLKA